MITAKEARRVWQYHPDNGHLTWKIGGHKRRIGAIAGTMNGRGYWRIIYRGTSYQRSHMVWLYVTGKWPKDEMDHINRDRADDRLENLREASHSQNMANRKLFKNNKLGVRGVSRQDSGYVANIRLNGVRHYLGYFKTIEEAKKVYDEAARRIFGNFATTKGE